MNPILISVLTGLATAGFLNLTTKNEKGQTQIFSENKPVISFPDSILSDDRPYSNLKNYFSRVLTSSTVKPTSPNFKIQNVSNNILITSINLIFDANAKASGALEIVLDSKSLIEIPTTGLTDVDGLSLPIPKEGLSFASGSTIEVFFYNPTGLTSAFTFLLTVGNK